MDVPITEERKEISILFAKKEYDALSKFGIKMVEGAGPLDCGNYVVHKLGFHASPESVNIIWKAPRSERQHDGIILYRVKGNPVIQQHGFIKGDRVTSKWGKDEPVFEHRIDQVPVDYGDIAEFVIIDDNLRAALQQEMERFLGGGADYY